MSQHWNAHWANESFKPTRLRNWEVTNWHPCWPDKHCALTVVQTDQRGHILAGHKKSEYSPWGEFKGTWELPLKINRCCATKLSAPPQYKKDAWAVHKAKHRYLCAELREMMKTNIKKDIKSETTKMDSNYDVRYSEDKDPEPLLPIMRIDEETPEHPCLLHNICKV